MNNTECEFWPHQPSRCVTVTVLLMCFSILSFVGCLFIIAIICLFKMYKYFVQRLILYLTISAAIKVCLFFGRPSVISTGSCQFLAFMLQYFGWAVLLWICSITFNIVLLLHDIQTVKYEKYYHLFVWFVSLLWSVIPFFGNHYGPAGLWCWISRDSSAIRFGVWYIPLLVVVLLLVVVYLYIACLAFKRNDQDIDGTDFEVHQNHTLLQEEVKPLLTYPVIYLLFNLPMLIYRIDDITHPDNPPRYALLILSVITSPLLGLINALAFSLYQDTLKMLTFSHIKGAFLSCCEDAPSRITHNYTVVDSNPDNISTTKYGAQNIA